MIFIHQFLVPNVNFTRTRYIKAGLNFFNSFNQHYLHMILQTGGSKVTYRPLGQLFKIIARSAAKFYLITGSLGQFYLQNIPLCALNVLKVKLVLGAPGKVKSL